MATILSGLQNFTKFFDNEIFPRLLILPPELISNDSELAKQIGQIDQTISQLLSIKPDFDSMPIVPGNYDGEAGFLKFIIGIIETLSHNQIK